MRAPGGAANGGSAARAGGARLVHAALSVLTPPVPSAAEVLGRAVLAPEQRLPEALRASDRSRLSTAAATRRTPTLLVDARPPGAWGG